MNYKGIYFNDDPNSKYTCPITGAHFEFKDMCQRMKKVMQWRRMFESKLQQLQGIHSLVEIEDSADSDIDSESKKKLLQQEKEEFMRKMGIVKKKQIEEKQKNNDLNNEVVTGAYVNQKEKQMEDPSTGVKIPAKASGI